jgi:hypothetical protein
LGPPTVSIPGSIFCDAAGVWPVVSGEGLLASGIVDAGGRSGVALCGCPWGFELSAGGLSPLGVCVWPSAAPEPIRNATAAKITAWILMGVAPFVGRKGNAAPVFRVPE